MSAAIHSKIPYQIISRHGVADVVYNTDTSHHSLHAAIDFKTGDVVVSFDAAATQNHATYLTVQTGVDRHIVLSPSFLQYVNHSCDPNVFFDTSAMQLVCIRTIRTGDELCFFYPSAEWEMARPFKCHCGSRNCLDLISGAANLNIETLRQYRLTAYIAERIVQKS